MHTGVTLQTRSFKQTDSLPPVTSERSLEALTRSFQVSSTSCVDAALAEFPRAYMN